jgi:hypothetical protein
MYHRRHLLERIHDLAREGRQGSPGTRPTTSAPTEAQLDLRPELGQVRQRLLEILGAIPLELIGESRADVRLISLSNQFHRGRIQASLHHFNVAGRVGWFTLRRMARPREDGSEGSRSSSGPSW